MLGRFWRGVLLWAGAFLMAGCAGVQTTGSALAPREALDQFALAGRFSMTQGAQSYSGRLNWTHRAEGDLLLLSSPFGQGLAQIVREAGGVRLTAADGRVFEASDVEALTQEVLGYPVPLALLADWVRGHAGAGRALRDDIGRLTHLEHEAWSIDFAYANSDSHSPPSRIQARRAGEFELRLVIDEWRSLSSEES